MDEQRGTVAAHFKRYMTLLSAQYDLDAIGLTIVIQEGFESAGHPDSVYLAKGSNNEDLAEQAKLLVEKHLNDGEELRLPSGIEALELIGNFKNRVGYIWIMGRISPLLEQLRDFAKDVTLSMENSKKSGFHLKFFQSMINTHGDIVENVIAETIVAGLYCQKVIAWERKDDRLLSVNHKGYGLAVGNSLATSVLENKQFITVENIKTDTRNILYRDELIREGINSFFLFPVLDEDVGDTSGVIGVFYNRPFGTTEVDQFLCEFVIRYYENIWKLERKVLELTGVAAESQEARQFHENAVKTLVDLHELKANFLSVTQAFSDAMAYGHANPNLQKSLKTAGIYLDRSKKRLLKHQHSFVMANEYIELIYARERGNTEKFNLRSAIEREISAHISEAEDLGCKTSIKFELPKRLYRTNKEDILSVCNNFLRNAIQSLQQKNDKNQKNRIKFSVIDTGPELIITCEDNGVGISEENIKKVFDVHYTSNEELGGQGLGLAIVHAICLKHGNLPTAESVWGKYAEFSAKVRSY